jgi:competence protein ComEC
MLLHVVLVVLRGLARVPYASVPVSAGAPTLWAFVIVGGLGVLVVWPQPSRASVQRIAVCITLAVVVLVAHWRFLAPARVCVLDVGQGDAILIQDGPSAILVDAGPPDGSLPKALARNHVLHLDAVVLTHLHDDHYGGLMDLEGHVGVGEVIVAAGAKDNLPEELDEAVHELTGSSCEEICYHNQLQVGGFTLLAVWPRTEVDGLDNPDSLELTIAYTGRGRELRGLLTGDAEQDETGAVIAAGEVGDIDFLKVGHHGSEVSLTSEQAEALAPEVAVASAGEGNAYGHPRKECVEALVSAGARFLCTKDVGDVELRPGRDGVMVRTATSRR